MSEGGGRREWGREARERLARGAGHAWRLIVEAGRGISLHRGTQMAASMSYYALLSLFPTAIVIAAAAGLILDDQGARQEAVDFLFRELPLTEEEGRSDIEQVLAGVTRNSGTLGLIGLAGLLVSASALVGAVRNSINAIHGYDVRRGLLRGKALDVLFILGLGVLFILSFATTLVGQLDVTFTGRIGDAIERVIDLTGALLPLALAAVVFTILFKVLPVRRPALRDIWPGVLIATLGYELLKRGFTIYLDNFADYSAIYGSLGAVVAFMFFVWLASLVFLFAAEVAALWPRVRAGELDPDPDEEGKPLGEQLRGFLASLVRKNEVERRADPR